MELPVFFQRLHTHNMIESSSHYGDSAHFLPVLRANSHLFRIKRNPIFVEDLEDQGREVAS